MTRLHALGVLAVAIIASGLAVLVVVNRSSERTPSAPPTPVRVFRPDHTTVASCHGAGPCLEQAYGNIAYRNGPNEAMRRLKLQMRTSADLAANCHGIGHAVGQAAMAAHPERMSRYLTTADRGCAEGVPHGVITFAFAGVPAGKMQPRISRICEALRVDWPDDSACGHPVGHGLMLYFGNNLGQALGVCRDIRSSVVRSSCADGVYMVAFVDGQAEKMTDLVRANDRFYPCSVAPREEQGTCFRQIADRFWRLEKTWPARFAACEAAPAAWVQACHVGLGRRIATSEPNPAAMARVCGTSPDPDTCFGQAATQRAGIDFHARQAIALCELAPGSIRRSCFSQFGSHLHNILSPAGVRRECAREPVAPLAAACRAGSPATVRG